MAEQTNPHEIREQLEQFEEAKGGWKMFLAVTTALIAVIAAVFSLQSSYYADLSILEKNNAVLLQNKTTDQWNYYQAKGVKKNLAEGLSEINDNPQLKQEAVRYKTEQEEIQKKAQELEGQVEEANKRAEGLFEKHHQVALGVTFFQIAIALSAISALLDRKTFWILSILLTIVGLWFAVAGILH